MPRFKPPSLGRFCFAWKTICPRISDKFYIISYYIKWVTTSWNQRQFFESRLSTLLLPLWIFLKKKMHNNIRLAGNSVLVLQILIYTVQNLCYFWLGGVWMMAEGCAGWIYIYLNQLIPQHSRSLQNPRGGKGANCCKFSPKREKFGMKYRDKNI